MGIEVLRTGLRRPYTDDDVNLTYREYARDTIRELSGTYTPVMGGIFEEEDLPGSTELFAVPAAKPLPSSSRAKELASKYGDTVWSSLEFAKRIGAATDWENFFPFTRKDWKNELMNPKGIAYKQGAADLATYKDEAIIAACTADVWEEHIFATGGSALQRTQSLATFPTDNILLDSANEGFTKSRVLKLNEKFLEYNVPIDSMESYLVIGPKQRTQAKDDEVITSADYIGAHPLTTKAIPMVDGHNVLCSSKLSTVVRNGYTYRKCLCVFPGALVGGVEEDMYVSIDKRPDKGTTSQLALAKSLGFIRVDDNLILVLECVELPGLSEPAQA